MMTIDTVDLGRLSNRLDELADAMGGNEVAAALLAGAFVLEAEAKQNVQRMKAIDTGFMLNSIYSSDGNDSGYRPGGDRMLPEYKPPKAAAAVCVGAEYGMYVEYGTIRMPARPFMRQAVETHVDDAIDAIGEAIDRKMQRIFR